MEASDVKAFFEQVASDWDQMRLAYYDERVIERLAALAVVDDDRGATVIDVGTGTGFLAAGLAGRVGRVIGVDACSASPRATSPHSA